MSVMNRSTGKSVLPSNSTSANQLSLYDQHGAVAYGVILQLIPQPQLAQEVLVDLFASSELQAAVGKTKNVTCTVARLARDKALEYRRKQQTPPPAPPVPTRQNELIFNLLFYQNQPADSVAERLQIQRSAVFSAVREFFAHFLPS